MKKIMMSLLAGTILFASSNTFASDASNTLDFDWENDSQYYFQLKDVGSSWVTRGKEGYYIRLGDLLYFADFQLEMVFPLCSKPECTHQGEEEIADRANCEAYLGNSDCGYSLQYYQDMIYGVSLWDFAEEEPYSDFTGRLYSFSSDGLYRKEAAVQAAFKRPPVLHRGYCYYVYAENSSDNAGKVTTVTRLARQKVDGSQEEILLADNEINALTGLLAYQDYIYFTYWIDNDRYILIYNTKNGESHYLSEDGYEAVFFSFEGDHMLLTYAGTEDDQPVYVADLDGTVTGQLEDFLIEPNCKAYSDGTYLYVDNESQYELWTGEIPWKISYYDRDTLEYVGDLEIDSEIASPGFLPIGDENYTFWYKLKDDGETEQIWYLDKSKLADQMATPQLLLEGKTYNMSWTSLE